jgi:hypothetical protein
MNRTSFELATPAFDQDDFDWTAQLSLADRDDWALLRLVAAVTAATLVIALAASFF